MAVKDLPEIPASEYVSARCATSRSFWKSWTARSYSLPTTSGTGYRSGPSETVSVIEPPLTMRCPGPGCWASTVSLGTFSSWRPLSKRTVRLITAPLP